MSCGMLWWNTRKDTPISKDGSLGFLYSTCKRQEFSKPLASLGINTRQGTTETIEFPKVPLLYGGNMLTVKVFLYVSIIC